MVGRAYDMLCATRGMEIVGRVPVGKKWQDHRGKLDKADVVIVNGEGTLHGGAEMDMLDVAAHYPSYLINTVWQGNGDQEKRLLRFKRVTVRESASARSMLANSGIEPEVVGDVILKVLSGDYPPKRCYSKKPQFIGSVKESDRGWSAAIPALEMCRRIRTCDDALVIGRFHGILLAAMLNVPFVAYRSNSHKNEGVMLDMGLDEYFVDPDCLLEHPEVPSETAQDYVRTQRARISKLFDDIANGV